MCLLCSELTDGTVEAIDGSSRHIRISNTQLFLTYTEVADSGQYVCNATNNVGFDTQIAYLTVLGKNISRLIALYSYPEFCQTVS